MPDTSTAAGTRDWEASYRQLMGEFDRAEGDWGEREQWLSTSLVKLLACFEADCPGLGAKLGQVRELVRSGADAERLRELLNSAVEACVRSELTAGPPADGAGGATGARQAVAEPAQGLEREALAEMLRALSVPPGREFELRQLADKLARGDDAEQTLRYLQDLLEELLRDAAPAASEPGTAPAGDKPSTPPHEVLVHLLDRVSLSLDFEARATSLKGDLGTAASADPVRDTATLLNDFHDSLREDTRELEVYLANASGELEGIQNDMLGALERGVSAQSDRNEFGRRMSEGVDGIHEAIDQPPELGDPRTAVEERLRGMRAAVSEFLDQEHRRREEQTADSLALAARLKQLETETNDLRERLAESQARARVDALTGVPNRLALEDQLHREFERARRHKHPFSYAVLDLDFFKVINDTYGHAAGDKVLQQVARFCTKVLRTNDFFARYGGEEFVMLLPDTAAEDAVTVANKLRETIAKLRFHHGGERVNVSLSVGVAGLREGDTPVSLFERADQALYRAKQNGRDRVECATP